MEIIDGKKISEEIRDDLRKRGAPDEFFAAILVGDDPASLKFVERKKKFAESVGVEFKLFKTDVSVTMEDMETMIRYLAADAECGGIMLQLPLPATLDREKLFKLIPTSKDVDALNKGSLVGAPAVIVTEEILTREGIDISNATIAVLGAGFLVGGPIAEWLKPICGELTVIDKGDDISPIKEAEVVILGTGQRGLVDPSILKNDAVVIDFGCSMSEEGKVCGDLNVEGIEDTDIRYTPTPGGTGPILVAKLFDSFYKLNNK